MSNEAKDLFMKLLHADSVDEVVGILKEAGYWDDQDVWRPYGDKEGNYSIIGNQQAEPETALVEKIINSVDASLMNQCLIRGIDPESADAPEGMREAVAKFFRESNDKHSGYLREWGQQEITNQAHNITIAATGSKKTPCISIADKGEGQSPSRLPDTILSLDKENKQRIKFVQGKFNMGGSGVLRHCSDDGIQLVVSRRNPVIVSKMNKIDESSDLWGFTVVRRVEPRGKPGDQIHSEYKYLAPIKATNGKAEGVLSFQAASLPLMPKANKPYVKDVEWGTLVKLYEYEMSKGSSNILMKNGLMSRLEVLLPEIALPVRIHECRREYRGHGGSFDTNLAGLVTRIEVGKGDSLEMDPWDLTFTIQENKFTARVYVFKSGKSKTYIGSNNGIIFTINGQTHGGLPRSFFERKSVGLSRIGKDIIVIIDCSDIHVRSREDLFMSSRDRLSKRPIRKLIEKELERSLSDDRSLKKLQEKRRAEEQNKLLKDDKPLEEVLKNVIKSSPALSEFFIMGQRLSSTSKANAPPSGTLTGDDGDSGSSGVEPGASNFSGNKHPTYFRFKKLPKHKLLCRDCEYGRTIRIDFDTDVENQYFSRPDNQGRYEASIISGRTGVKIESHSINLHDGLASWNIKLSEDVVVGDVINVETKIEDDVILDPIINTIELTIKDKVERKSGSGKRNKKKASGNLGEDEIPDKLGGLDMPHVREISREEWEAHDFDGHSSCAFTREGDNSYTFYVNVDNKFLQKEMKTSKEPALIKKKFVYGNVLIALALIYEFDKDVNEGENDDEMSIKNRVVESTRAIGPFIVPMIDALGALKSDDVSSLSDTGDDE